MRALPPSAASTCSTTTEPFTVLPSSRTWPGTLAVHRKGRASSFAHHEANREAPARWIEFGPQHRLDVGTAGHRAHNIHGNEPTTLMELQVDDPFAGQKRTRGGSRDTDVNEFTVMPTEFPWGQYWLRRRHPLPTRRRPVAIPAEIIRCSLMSRGRKASPDWL